MSRRSRLDLKGEYAISDENLTLIFEKDFREAREKIAQKLFKKAYDQITAGELTELCEEIMKGLFMFRKNTPFGFVAMVNLAVGHPKTPFLDRNNLRIALDMFHFDLNEMNKDKFIVEQDIDFVQGLRSEFNRSFDTVHETFYGRHEGKGKSAASKLN